MKKIFTKWFDDGYAKIALGLFLIGLFLRLYRLNDFVTFLGDQGRDAMIIKRILTFEHFPAIGAPTSVGQVYLGPFYYYFIAPWLLFFRFDPIGLAFGVAIFSSLYLLINYFIVKDLFNKKIALISTILITFSSTLIEYSRFSWNPNLLPLFSLITFYVFTKAIQTKKLVFFILTGAFVSFAIQLHYLSLFLAPPMAIIFIVSLVKNPKRLKTIFMNWGSMFLSFLFFSLPLVIFDLRHNFLNSRNFIELFNTGENVVSNKIGTLIDSFGFLNSYFFSITFNHLGSGLILATIIIFLLTIVKKSVSTQILTFFFLMIILGVALYNGPKYPHYFGMIYPIYAIIIGYLLSLLFLSSRNVLLLAIFLGAYIKFQSLGYIFIAGRGSHQIDHAKKVAVLIKDNIRARKYTMTGLPNMYSDSIYRYFLELWGKKAIEKDNLERADELFVVCDAACWPIGDPQWDIAYFAPNKVEGKWRIDNVTIFKLIR